MFYNNGLTDIKILHLEISSRCNAACPQCPRNFYGYPFNDGYIERDLSLEEIKKIFCPFFINQLEMILINGNFGDIVMNHDALEIIKYFRDHGQENLQIQIITNGGARNSNFWRELAKLKCLVTFCLEGIDNRTHALYRQNTLYQTVLKNAQTFVSAGGSATWKMIKFEHNLDQIEQARQISKNLGFANFELIDDGRDTGPVYNSAGELVHIMKSDVWKNMGRPTDFSTAIELRKSVRQSAESLNTQIKPKISCKVLNPDSIYVSSTGHVYPCCWLGMSPETYGHGCYMEGANTQLRSIISENNALEFDLEHCILWFSRVRESWNKQSVAEGRLIHCNDNCGCN